MFSYDSAMAQSHDRQARLGSERDRPPHFAGRRAELDALARRCAFVRETGDASGGMVLVDGVQGVGKTQLVDEFARRAVGGAEPPGAVAWMSATTVSLDGDPAAFFLAALDKLGPAERNAGARVALSSPQQPAKSLEGMLAQSKAEGLWDGRVLILTVDEVQNVTAEERRILRVLHEARHGCPIMVIGAGLQHAAERLAGSIPTRSGTPDNGHISRFANRLTLAALSHEEAVEAVTRGLQALGHDINAAAADALARASMGFPQHIHGYLEGACEAIRRHGSGDSANALRTALANGDAARRRYYEGRLGSMAHPRLMLELAARMERNGCESLPWNEAVRVLAPPAGNAAQAEEALVDGVARGVLTRDMLHDVSFSIPSFHAFMVALCEQDASSSPAGTES